ncbi:MAG TPA: efflux RND transporter periplasmic adaptor subunit [Candidatus Ozemobacteraceae bacterium]|nr:efflux RND transporter periplasmic adaptor subunit [Candidatus Ozemobacteraceae bacterium]HNW09784.1 efflux RND transporter periplasmic adaptor subunit [Candidatus Rifleibacterium sp.]
MKKLIIAVILCAILIAGGIGWHFLRPSSQSREYSTEAVTRGHIRTTISSSGSLAALTTVEIGSQVSGNILKIYADFNDEVKAGQLIAELEASSFEAQLQQAKANLENAVSSELATLAQMKNLEASRLTAQADIQASLANVRKAEVAVEEAERNYRRIQELFDRKLISASERDSAKTALDSQKASLDSTKAQSQASKVKELAIKAQFEALEAERKGAQARIRQMEAQLSVSKINLDRTKIYSPIDGVVISREVDEGQTVAASLQAPKLFVIAQDLKKMQIDTAVDETDIGVVAHGQPVTFTVDAYKDRTFKGVVDQVRLSPTENSNVVTYSVMVRVENDDLLLKPGMTANAEILVGERQNVLRLPAKALYFKAPEELTKMSARRNGHSGSGQGGARRREDRNATDTIPVWLMPAGGNMELKTVKIGFSNQDYIELPGEELKEGDQVVIGIRGEAANGSNSSRRGSVRMRL